TQLGNAWDMDAATDIDSYMNISPPPAIQTIAAETEDGTSLGNSVRVLWGTSTAAQSGSVGDPLVQPLATRASMHTIDPNTYRILTVEYGLPNLARDINAGSIARVVWRVAGDVESVSDDIIINSLQGTNVMNKLSVDMADRTVLPIDQGSTAGWVYGTSGIDRFRFDPHEFSNPTSFYIRRIKLAALERINSGTTYTFRWTASKAGTVYLYYDTDKNGANGVTFIGSTSA